MQVPLSFARVHRHPGIRGCRKAGGVGGGGSVLGISTILYASAVQIKCKLKLSALALRKGDANLLLISLLCIGRHHRGAGELLWEGKEGIAERS